MGNYNNNNNSQTVVPHRIMTTGMCKGDCKLDLAKLAGGPKLIYYNNKVYKFLTHLAGGPKRIGWSFC